jgi:hypothetical protein
MAETTKASGTDKEGPQSIDDVVRVKDLQSSATNPNFPRSMFAQETAGSTLADADSYVSVTDAANIPGEGFKAKSISGKAIQMNTGFDANGVPGNAGDWLVYAGGHWFVARDKDL